MPVLLVCLGCLGQLAAREARATLLNTCARSVPPSSPVFARQNTFINAQTAKYQPFSCNY